MSDSSFAHDPQFSSSPDLLQPRCLLRSAALFHLLVYRSLGSTVLKPTNNGLHLHLILPLFSNTTLQIQDSCVSLAQACLFPFSLFSPLPLSICSLSLLSAPFRLLLSLCSRSLFPLCVGVVCVRVWCAKRTRLKSHR